MSEPIIENTINTLCILCDNEMLNTDKKAEFSCGCHTVHTRCILRVAYSRVIILGNFTCGTCGVTLCTYPNQEEIDSLDPPLEQPQGYPNVLGHLKNLKKIDAFKTALQKVRLKNSIYAKAACVFKKKLTEEFKKFNIIVRNTKKNLKITKQNALKNLKQSVEYKNAIQTHKESKIAINSFKRRFNLGWQESRLLKIHGPLRRRFRRKDTLSGKFSIGIRI